MLFEKRDLPVDLQIHPPTPFLAAPQDSSQPNKSPHTNTNIAKRASLPSRRIRRPRTLQHNPNRPRSQILRSARTRRAYGVEMGNSPRPPLHHWRWTLRRKSSVPSPTLTRLQFAKEAQARWPERSAPGSFDIWGSSHQLFHIFVLVAAAVHLYGLTVAFDFYRVVPGNKC